MTDSGTVIGVDIGGTGMSAALVDAAQARVLNRETIPTEAARGPEDGLRRLGDLIERVAGAALPQVRGIGIGCTGPVDCETGRIHNPYTLPTWDDVPLTDYLESRFRLPTALVNDAHAAALGEYWAGAGRGTQHMLYLTISTGIGGGFILNGKLYRGVGLLSSEVGHMALDPAGPACYCGATGCLEMLAAGPAIAAQAAAQAPDASLILRLAGGDRAAITARLVAQAADAGDSLAHDLLARAGYWVGVGIANLLNLLTPEVIVLGGGVMNAHAHLLPSILETVQARAALVPFERIRITRAQRGADAGVVGAARAWLDAPS
jgi:glucokinase